MTRIREYYDAYWTDGIDRWHAVADEVGTFEERFLSPHISAGCRVLDFGCGDGAHVGGYLVSRGCQYVGLDISEAAVSACRGKGLAAEVCKIDEPLPLSDGRFDLVVSFEVLEHLFSPADVLDELRRLLRPGGRLLGSVPNAVYLGNRVLMMLGHFSPGGTPATSLKKPWIDPHVRFFSKRTLSRLLKETGFQDIRVVGRPFSLTQLPVLFRAPRASSRILDSMSAPLGPLGSLWPSLFSYRLYYSAQK